MDTESFNLFIGHAAWSEQMHIDNDLKSAVQYFVDPSNTSVMKVLSSQEIEEIEDTSVVAIVTTGSAAACGSCASLHVQLEDAIADKNAALDISIETQKSCDRKNAELSEEKMSLTGMMEAFSTELKALNAEIKSLKEDNSRQDVKIERHDVMIESLKEDNSRQDVKIERQDVKIESLTNDILVVFGCTRAHYLALAAEILRLFILPVDSKHHSFNGFVNLSEMQATTITNVISDLALDMNRFKALANNLVNDRNHAVHFSDFTELDYLADEAVKVFNRMAAHHPSVINADNSMKFALIVLEKRHHFFPPSGTVLSSYDATI